MLWKGHNLNFEYQSPKTSPCCGYLAVPRVWKSIWATCSENTNTELQYGCNFWPFDRMAIYEVCYTKLNLRHVERNTIFSIILHLCQALHNSFLLWKSTGGFLFVFLDFLCTIFNTASSAATQILRCRSMLGSNPVPEFIDPVSAKTSLKRSFSVKENERLGHVFAKTGSINSGTGLLRLWHWQSDALTTPLDLIHCESHIASLMRANKKSTDRVLKSRRSFPTFGRMRGLISLTPHWQTSMFVYTNRHVCVHIPFYVCGQSNIGILDILTISNKIPRVTQQHSVIQQSLLKNK